MVQSRRVSLLGSNRLIIIGLDGGTFDLLLPLLEKGYMPNFQRLLREGVWGKLESTIPPVTAPAWATFATGKNPGKHGVFDFQVFTPGQERRFISSADIQGDRFWHLLAQAGLSTGLIGLPLTYPPEPLRGFVISGMLTPSLDAPFTFPANLRKKVLEVAPGYVPDVDLLRSRWQYHSQESLQTLVDRLEESLQQRGRLVRYLSREEDWDVLVAVITELDRVQHLMFKLLGKSQVSADWQELQQSALNLYRQADKIIGELRELMDDRTTLFVVSDHGFGPLDKRFNLNAWLAEKNLLQFRSSKSLLRGSLKWLVQKTGLDRYIPDQWRQRASSNLSVYDCIDWSATYAYAGTPLEQGVRINLRGREPNGQVSPGSDYLALRLEIAQMLRETRDPQTGAPLFDRVYAREELYQGPCLRHAPDLVFSMYDYRCVLAEGLPDQPLFGPFPFAWAGYHTPQGIFVSAGSRIDADAVVENAHLADIAPTILHLFGRPIPTDMDGRVLEEIMQKNWIRSNPVEYYDAETDRAVEMDQGPYTEEETAALEGRLRGLGYLG